VHGSNNFCNISFVMHLKRIAIHVATTCRKHTVLVISDTFIHYVHLLVLLPRIISLMHGHALFTTTIILPAFCMHVEHGLTHYVQNIG
jgi:hypothetical protein